MDFDKPKVYGDTSITDGLVYFNRPPVAVFFEEVRLSADRINSKYLGPEP